MAHKKPEGLGGIGIVPFPNHLVKHLPVHMVTERHPYRVIITHAEMVAGNDLTAADGGKILNPPHLLDDKLTVGDHFIKKARACPICDFVFDFTRTLLVQIIHHIRHQRIGLGIVLHVQMPKLLFFKLLYSSKQFQLVSRPFHFLPQPFFNCFKNVCSEATILFACTKISLAAASFFARSSSPNAAFRCKITS